MTTAQNQPGETGRVRVKICGITSIDDARLAVEAGADAIGINMVAGPRRVQAEAAAAIIESVGAGMTEGEPISPWPVLLVKLGERGLDDTTESVIARSGVRWLQLYGEVGPEAIRRQTDLGRYPVPVVHVADEGFAERFDHVLERCGDCRPRAVVLDAYYRDKLGGGGEVFRWEWLIAARQRGTLADWPPIVLAGGLAPHNVIEAVRTVRPWMVDVSSGVEASAGRKDPARLREFIHNAKSVPL
jgi:phosphoribosylanthranilate isomerase